MVPPCSDRVSRAPPYSRTSAHHTPTGLSPTLAGLSRPLGLICRGHWPTPRSLATTSGISFDVFSFGYLDVSVPRVRLPHLWIQCRISLRRGCPIRTSADQRSLASPRGFSQRATSFIASWRQGIHRTPLSRSTSPTPARTQDQIAAPGENQASSNAKPYAQLHSQLLLNTTNPRFTCQRTDHPNARDPKARHRQGGGFWKRAALTEQVKDTRQARPSLSRQCRDLPPAAATGCVIPRRIFSRGVAARENGGDRIRTDDPLLAKQVLYQLSYAPAGTDIPDRRNRAYRGSAAICRRARAPATGLSHPPGDFSRRAAAEKMGQGGLEPPTPRLSSVCSNQLSY